MKSMEDAMKRLSGLLFVAVFFALCSSLIATGSASQGKKSSKPTTSSGSSSPQDLTFPTNSQGTAAPIPDPSLRFLMWQNNQSSTASADLQSQFNIWQGQRTSADSINLFRCSTSTDLDSPECVGKLPGTRITGTKDAKTPTTLPVRKSKTGEPD